MQKVDETKRALRATNIPDHPIAISSNLKEDGCNTAVGPGNQVWIIFSGLWGALPHPLQSGPNPAGGVAEWGLHRQI
jgi:hypothetical protein